MNQEKCLTPKCVRPEAIAMGRGLCLNCYSKAKKMVESGVTTWKEIVALGLAKTSEGEDGDPFTQAFNEAKKGK